MGCPAALVFGGHSHRLVCSEQVARSVTLWVLVQPLLPYMTQPRRRTFCTAHVPARDRHDPDHQDRMG